MQPSPRRTFRGLSAAGLALGIAITGLAPTPAQASVFVNAGHWPPNPEGYVIVHVCVVPGSSALEKADGAAAGLIHDPNPSLDEVIAHVQGALASSWERVGGVRFVDWKPCDVLTSQERRDAIGLYIHPDAANEAAIGKTAAQGHLTAADHSVSFKPWGNDFNRCIVYDALTTHMSYRFDCVEQYSIHEFGHILGFEHEWRHPSTPAACLAERNEAVVPPGSYSSAFEYPAFAYTIVSDECDMNSIMTYDDACADVTGVRFGSPNLSPTDGAGVTAVYPKPAVGAHDVGVVPDRMDDCPGEVIVVHMDDEDDANADAASGWIGASHQDHDTTLVFCRASHADFRAAPPSSQSARDGDYALLKLGPSCPPGSEEFFRQFDNEDNDNHNSLSGRAAPNVQNADGTTSTRLYFCLFRPETTGVLTDEFPYLGYAYGVFAAPDFTFGLEFGAMHVDDEDDANADISAFSTFEAGPAASRIFTFGPNTDLRLARVRTTDFTVDPVGTPSSPQRVGTTEACSATIDVANGFGGTCHGATSLCLFEVPPAKPTTSLTLGLGDATVNVVGVGLDGYRKSRTSYVTVFDATAPDVNCTAPQIAECRGVRTIVAVDAQCTDACGACTADCSVPPSGFLRGHSPVRCTATDAAGNLSRCNTEVTVIDTVAPAVTCPAPLTVECTGSRSAAATYAASAEDACDGAVLPTCSPASGTLLPLGTTPVVCAASDASGNRGECATSITVSDTRPPAVSCPAPVVVECTGQRQAVAQFTASASDVCDGALTPSCTPPSGASFPLGTTQGSCGAGDDAGNAASCAYSVTVRDTIAPTISEVTASPNRLWPPNRRMVPVTIGVSELDACDPAASCRIVGVASDESGGPDWNITGALSLDLRAKRDGRGDGRTYTVAVECRDVSGNASRAAVSVEVPIRP